MFRGDLHDFEWHRFRSYARRVRAITNAGRVNINPIVFRELLHLNNGHPLIPALEEFDGNIPLVHADPNHYDINDAELMSVVSPSLRRLDIRLHDTTGRLQPPFPVDDVPQILLEKLGFRLPRLESLRILCQGIGPHLPTSRILSVASMVSFAMLTSVDVLRCRSSCTSDLLHHLATLPYLVNFSAEICANDGRAAISPSGFRSIRQLHVKGSIERVRELIATIASPHVRVVRVQQAQEDNFGTHTEQEWCDLIDALAAQFGGTLREVNLATAFHSSEVWHPHEAVAAEHAGALRLSRVLRPLLELSQLEFVALAWHIERTRLDMRDEDVFVLTAAWPRLRSLELRFENAWQLPVETLVHWARLCPFLTHLVLPSLMDREHSTVESFPRTDHRLRYIHFGRSLRPERRARILDRLFPYLDMQLSQQDGRFLGRT